MTTLRNALPGYFFFPENYSRELLGDLFHICLSSDEASDSFLF